MKLDSRALVAKENEKSPEPIDDDVPKRLRRPRRIIEDDSSSSDSDGEDHVPLNKRKVNQKAIAQEIMPTKKLKLTNHDQFDSPRKVFDLGQRTKHRHPALQKDSFSSSLSKQFKEPRIVIKNAQDDANRMKLHQKKGDVGSVPAPKSIITKDSNIQQTRSDTFKTPAPSNTFQVPLPLAKPNNEFKAPLPLQGLSNGFKAPLPPSTSSEFKTPMGPPAFASPEIPAFTQPQQSELISSRLSHYMNCICQDLDQYNMDKIKSIDSLLTFREDDDLATLDITVMRKFTLLTSNTIRHYKNLDSIDMEKFGKVIKLMENTVIVSTDIDMIAYYGKNPTDEKKKPTLDKLALVSDALEACSMIFEILTTCKLDKKFLSRNLITNCLHLIKNQLDYTVYPILDLDSFEDEATSLLSDARAFLNLILSSPKDQELISNYIPHIIRFFRRAFTLILSEELDDDVLVIIAYISMAPFFHDYSDTSKSILLATKDDETTFSYYEQLKFCALDILKHIFSKYPKHRRWIFEEILTSLGSLTTMDGAKRYRLRDNRSIHVISALFMQLVQCSSSLSDLYSHKTWFSKWNIKYQKVYKSKDMDQIKMLDDKLLRRASTAWRQGAEAAANSASFFLEFLMSKCKSRKADSYSLAEYRQILEQTLQDIMAVFNDPDWPVAELIMRVFSRILVSLLDGNHSDQYLKSLAIEWLGIICSKIKTGYNKLSGGYKTYTPEWIYELNESLPIKVDNETPLKSIALLDQCRKQLLNYELEERVNQNVTHFYLCNWGFIESVVWSKANKGWEVEEKKPITKMKKSTKEEESLEDDINQDTTMMDSSSLEEDPKWPKEAALLLGDTCKYYWLACLGVDHPFPRQVPTHFEFPEMSRSDYVLLTELLASRQTLYTSFNFMLTEILTCLDKDAVIYRTKALKAIGKIASEVPEILEDKRIRTAVVLRVHDGSPSVRDAAVDVVAKYLGRLDTVPLKLYEIVSGRIMDTAMNVRKRLVKLLRELYFKFTDPGIKIDIASKLILRIGDNEISISQLALKATQEILFLPFKEIEKDGNDYFGFSYANSPKNRKRKITELTCIITGAVSKLDPSISAQNAALTQIIQKTVDGADEKSALWYEKVLQWIVDSLFDRMIVLDEEDNSTEFIHCLATVYSFTKSCPNLLRETHISMLQPYLSVSGQAEWIKARYVLTIYRDVLPYMKYHDPEFIQSVERALMQLLSRCPLDLISYGVSCLCVVVDRISHRYNILIKMLGSCITKLRKVRELITQGDDSRSLAGVLKMLMLCGLLCQHFEFDKKREQEPKAMEALNIVYKGSIGILVFDLLQFFTGDYMDELDEQGITLRMTALQGLGYFFASHPTFMISNTSTELMDKIFDQGTTELKTQLMHVFQEFLSAEEKRIDKRQEADGASLYSKTIDVDTLLGNTEEYAELGVNGSLMQRYLRKILKCALSESEQLRYAAFEVVSAVVHQGLAHPVLCMTAIVAAETSPDMILRNKAYYLHKYAHDKYGNLLYIQLNEYLSTSFKYQTILLGAENVRGYGKRGGDAKVDPVLGVTFSVLRDKKKPKLDFLTGLVKPFEFDLKNTTADDVDINYLKYLAENIITLDLCTTEEVLCMIYVMDRTLMTLGADLLSYVHFLKRQDIISVKEDTEHDKEMDSDLVVASKLALAMCILLYVKNLLVELYDIPDDEIREYNPNVKKRARDVTKDLEVENVINWNELLYFKTGVLNRETGSDACMRFEYLIMNDTTAVIIEDTNV